MLSMIYGLALLSLASSILAKTDLGGCTSTQAGGSIVYYVPDSGEVCSILDCGGGRAPPKTNVPGCAAYQGSQPYLPSFLPGYGFAGTLTAPSEPIPTQILTDSSAIVSPPAAASSTLVPVPSVTSTVLADTTTTLQTGAAATSLLSTSGLLFDTSALTSEVTNTISFTSAASFAPAAVTGNAAAPGMSEGKLVGAILGAVAGLAMI